MNNFLAGFKNWRVIRVGIAYLVVAWLVVQLVNNIAGPLNLPGWTPTLVIVLLAVGFPIAVVVVAVSEFGQGGTKSEGLAPAAGTAKKRPGQGPADPDCRPAAREHVADRRIRGAG